MNIFDVLSEKDIPDLIEFTKQLDLNNYYSVDTYDNKKINIAKLLENKKFVKINNIKEGSSFEDKILVIKINKSINIKDCIENIIDEEKEQELNDKFLEKQSVLFELTQPGS